MVQHITTLDGVKLKNTWLTIGSFDGVHLGHQTLIHNLNNNAHRAGAKSIVLTFHPHPAVVLRGTIGPFYLTTLSEKIEYLDQLNIDIVVTHPFTQEISQTSAREFVTYLHNRLGFEQLWVGIDFALGKGREGNVAYLTQLGLELGFIVHVVDPITANGSKVSSSHIRKLIKEGEVDQAIQLLGRPYRVDGEVIHGDGRGKSIGIPTANLNTSPEKLIPSAGVYACLAKVMGKHWPAAVNIGTRPTFKSDDPSSHVEAYILEFSGDLYSQTVSLEFISRLRGEVRFDNVPDLITQVHRDIDQTRQIVASYMLTS